MTYQERYVDLVTRRFRQTAPGPPWELLNARTDDQLRTELAEADDLSDGFALDSRERATIEVTRGWISQALMIRGWQREQPELFT